jgi:hypothetical protein
LPVLPVGLADKAALSSSAASDLLEALAGVFAVDFAGVFFSVAAAAFFCAASFSCSCHIIVF